MNMTFPFEERGAEPCKPAPSEPCCRALFEQAPEGILLADAHTRKVRCANSAAGRLLGKSMDELARLRIEDLHPAGSLPEVLERFEHQGPGAAQFFSQVPFTRPDGTTIVCSVTSNVTEIGGRRCIAIFLQDVTERLRAEAERRELTAQLQQAQKMEAIGTLAGGLAHDFNNILMEILGSVELLLLDKEAGHRDLPHLSLIEKGVMRAADLTRQVLGFAQASRFESRTIHLNALLTRLLDMFGRSRKHIRIRTRFQSDLVRVYGDPAQIEQAMLNLLVNAGQAMPEGGDLSLESANVEIAADSPERPPDAAAGHYACISVTDTGVGIDPSFHARIFEPFFTTRGRAVASGLGLSSTYGIVRSHKGFIRVQSQKGQGATFRVYLPAGPAASPSSPPAGVGPAGRTVLVVDDETMVADVCRQLLERIGCEAIVASSGAEAVALYEKHRERIDFIILDMIMPGMSGSDTFDRLKSMDPDAVILLSSGYSLNGQTVDLIERGCRGYIQKPFSIRQLKEKIAEIFPGD
jgi:PAS domain S-box-containing protein